MIVVNEDSLEIIEVKDRETEASSYVNELKVALNCETAEFSSAYNEYKLAEEKFKKLYDPFKARLLDLYKSEENMPSTIYIDNVKLTYVSPSTRSSIDNKKLKEEEPELAKKFTKTTNIGATIRIDSNN